MYVDDLAVSFSDVQSAIKVREHVSQILHAAGFHMRDWCSNNEQVMASIPREERSTDSLLTWDSDSSTKILGLLWNPQTDTFQYAVSSGEYDVNTKREMFSEIAKLYDPLGLVSPLIVNAKRLMQKLWQLQASWDDILPLNIISEWNTLRLDLHNLSELHVYRSLSLVETLPQSVQLHVFADSSEVAYGACAYLRVADNCNLRINLIAAKSRVAPLKKLTIPRLELCAALLAAQLYSEIKDAFQLKDVRSFLWSDATTVLLWLSSPPTRWKTFVAHRVALIQQLTSEAT